MKVNGCIYLCFFLLFAACSDKPEPFLESDRIAVRFSLSGIQAEVSTRADGDGTSPLAEGTTLRILAFRRVGTNADLSQDKYIGEGTYKANGGGSLKEVSSLLLPQGTYDFYALTPDLEVNKTGNSYTVSVNHGVDYASSLTAAVTVTEDNPSVLLTVLTRHCSRLVFNFLPKYDNIKSVTIHSVALTNMVKAPVVGTLNEPLTVETGNNETAITLTEFTSSAESPLEYSASTIVLPRQAGAFDFKMKVYINSDEETGEKEYSAQLPADLNFSPGYQYIFTVKLRGGKNELELSVAPWGVDYSYDTGDLGGYYTLELTLVEDWKDVPAVDDGGNLGEGNE